MSESLMDQRQRHSIIDAQLTTIVAWAVPDNVFVKDSRHMASVRALEFDSRLEFDLIP